MTNAYKYTSPLFRYKSPVCSSVCGVYRTRHGVLYFSILLIQLAYKLLNKIICIPSRTAMVIKLSESIYLPIRTGRIID